MRQFLSRMNSDENPTTVLWAASAAIVVLGIWRMLLALPFCRDINGGRICNFDFTWVVALIASGLLILRVTNGIRTIRWISYAVIPLSIGFVIISLLLFPVDYMRTLARVSPNAVWSAFAGGIIGALWAPLVAYLLSRPSVLKLQSTPISTRYAFHLPIAIGLVATVMFGAVTYRTLKGDDAQRMIAIAKARHGDQAQYFVQQINYKASQEIAQGMVVGWTPTQIRSFPITIRVVKPSN